MEMMEPGWRAEGRPSASPRGSSHRPANRWNPWEGVWSGGRWLHGGV